jgi:hypothetical protein
MNYLRVFEKIGWCEKLVIGIAILIGCAVGYKFFTLLYWENNGVSIFEALGAVWLVTRFVDLICGGPQIREVMRAHRFVDKMGRRHD